MFQLAVLISKSLGWDLDHVKNHLQVRLYCSARVVHPSGTTRTYWATESRYPFNKGKRRDMVEIDLGKNRLGLAQITTFIDLERLPEDANATSAKVILIRWMSPSSKSSARDNHNRPLCDFPLSYNHCLWEWSDAGRERQSFKRRGFEKIVDKQKMWSHIYREERTDAIRKEIRARYDIVHYDSLVRHANVAEDPTTGHFLQTLQMI